MDYSWGAIGDLDDTIVPNEEVVLILRVTAPTVQAETWVGAKITCKSYVLIDGENTQVTNGAEIANTVAPSEIYVRVEPVDSIFGRSCAYVHNYGFDIANLDERGRLLQGSLFELRTDPNEGASAIELVRVDWMDGSYSEDIHPEGPVYRLAVNGDSDDVRTTEIEAGKAIIVGLDSGTYYVEEKTAPARYLKDDEIHSVKLLSLPEGLDIASAAIQAPASDMDNDATAYVGRAARAGNDFAGVPVLEKLMRGCRDSWANLAPIQVDGYGLYSLSHFYIEENCFPGISLFDYDGETGVYIYGNTTKTLALGPDSDQRVQGTPENPLKGGLPVTNLPGLELPKTGGAGAEAYIILGSELALLAALLLLRRKRYR